jgi:hypothetical protein
MDPAHPRLSIQQQCELLGVPHSTYYYQPRPESVENLRLLHQLDRLYLKCPFYLNTMETGFCLAALNEAFRFGQPDGRSRALDNVFIERLRRSLKYELIYLGDFATSFELFPAL